MRRSWAPPGAAVEPQFENKDTRAKLYVYCEGENTEPGWLEFLQYFAREIYLEIVYCPNKGSAPKKVVEAALQKRKEILNSSKKRRDEVKKDEVWAVVDRDEHDLSAALQSVRDNGIGLVFSNPFFELWPLLHVQEHSAEIDRKELESLLHKEHQTYDLGRGAVCNWKQLSTGQE